MHFYIYSFFIHVHLFKIPLILSFLRFMPHLFTISSPSFPHPATYPSFHYFLHSPLSRTLNYSSFFFSRVLLARFVPYVFFQPPKQGFVPPQIVHSLVPPSIHLSICSFLGPSIPLHMHPSLVHPFTKTSLRYSLM